MRAKVVKEGQSRKIRIPRSLLESINLGEEEFLDLAVEGDHLIIRKSPHPHPTKSIKERFTDFEGDYQTVTVEWGDPVGEELW